MKKIAIVGYSTGPNSFGAGKAYLDLINELKGEAIIIMPNFTEEHHKELAETIDLLILPGGADLSSHHYGEAPGLFNSNPDVYKESFFVNHLSAYVKARAPIFGICLGFQMLNVFFEGKLIQHLYGGDLHASDKRGAAAHTNIDTKGVMFDVNSHHHQAVDLSSLGKSLIPCSYSNKYDKKVTKATDSRELLVESFMHSSLPIAGVQWHPEEWYDEHSRNLIRQISLKVLLEKKQKSKPEKELS